MFPNCNEFKNHFQHSTFVPSRSDDTSILNRILLFSSFNTHNNTNNNTIISDIENDSCPNDSDSGILSSDTLAGMNGNQVVLFNKSGISIVISSNNAIYKCDFEAEVLKYGDIFNGYYLPPYSTRTPRTGACKFTNSSPRLREQLVLKELFDIGKYDLDSDLNNVCGDSFNNFYENGYCYSPVAPARTPQIIIILNDSGIGIPRIDTRIYPNDFFKGVYGVVWDENNIVNVISSGM